MPPLSMTWIIICPQADPELGNYLTNIEIDINKVFTTLKREIVEVWNKYKIWTNQLAGKMQIYGKKLKKLYETSWGWVVPS